MKVFVALFCIFAAVHCDVVQTDTLAYHFLETDGVQSQTFTLPFNYAGSVNISTQMNTTTDMLFCVHWIVPAVAPFGENLNLENIWESTCSYSWAVNADRALSETGVVLRSGEYYLSVAVATEDIDSTGIVTTNEFDINLLVTYDVCNAGFFGDACTKQYAPLSFETETAITVSNTPSYFTLPTLNLFAETETLALFASSLQFSFNTTNVPEDVDFTLTYRLNGSPEDVTDGDKCQTSSSCSIHNPPFTATPGYNWGLAISASQDNVNTAISVGFTFCEGNNIGSNCEEYQTLDTEIGDVKKFSKKTILVFTSSVSVAVGGLDGYEQMDTAPEVFVQVDAEPFSKSDYNLLLSKGAETNVAIVDFTADSPDSKLVLSINPSKSFGIWKIDDDTSCPNGCENNGFCNTQEFVCECKDKYEDLDCGHEIKDFTIEYIILIAVGAILILAIAFGVPIYCYLNKNQDYETVA